jgi:hypothetical protein
VCSCGGRIWPNEQHIHCDFDHPHPEHPCGRRVIYGVTRCLLCGNLDGSTECEAAGCWTPATEAHLDSLYAEAWGIPDPGACLREQEGNS